MSSWGRSACYPQSTFYPLSDGPSMQNHRITISRFRVCSTRRSHSQACLCYCTPRTVTNRTEHTFESLRYAFGGDHPSQTTHHTMTPTNRVRHRKHKGRYFTRVRGTRHLHRDYNFTELMAETAPRSLHHSCRSELTRQGISLP